jgi:CheY-like chemotaxis protein
VPNTILIVDDSVAVRRLTRSYLERHCESVICNEASDGLEAIFKAEELSPDLIVMDLSMPRMNGLEAARILKSKAPHIPIVLFTMHENAIRRCEADLANVTAVVSKDKLDMLLAEVRTILKPRRVL